MSTLDDTWSSFEDKEERVLNDEEKRAMTKKLKKPLHFPPRHGAQQGRGVIVQIRSLYATLSDQYHSLEDHAGTHPRASSSSSRVRPSTN